MKNIGQLVACALIAFICVFGSSVCAEIGSLKNKAVEVGKSQSELLALRDRYVASHGKKGRDAWWLLDAPDLARAESLDEKLIEIRESVSAILRTHERRSPLAGLVSRYGTPRYIGMYCVGGRMYRPSQINPLASLSDFAMMSQSDWGLHRNVSAGQVIQYVPTLVLPSSINAGHWFYICGKASVRAQPMLYGRYLLPQTRTYEVALRELSLEVINTTSGGAFVQAVDALIDDLPRRVTVANIFSEVTVTDLKKIDSVLAISDLGRETAKTSFSYMAWAIALRFSKRYEGDNQAPRADVENSLVELGDPVYDPD